MIQLLVKRFITQDNTVITSENRKHVAQRCSLFGVFLNLILFCWKAIAGILSESIAILSDAFNNLSDAGSSLITLLGIRLSMKKPDPEHPFGHGRIEYLSGLAVSLLIILMGLELAKESFQKILSPTPREDSFFWISIVVLIASVLIKVYMWFYNRKYGAIIRSAAMSATAIDSLSDAVATFAVLISAVFARLYDIRYIDGICGFIVSLFILFAGFRAAKETLVPLLGQPADPELVREIKEIVLAHDEVLGIHDLMVHDYGPGRLMATLHAEVNCEAPIHAIHDVIDNIEKEIKAKLLCETVIHMDPVDNKDPQTQQLKAELADILRKNFTNITFHDFRVVYGITHTNLIFDIVKPFDCMISNEEICKIIREKILEKYENHFCVIQVDNDYTQT